MNRLGAFFIIIVAAVLLALLGLIWYAVRCPKTD